MNHDDYDRRRNTTSPGSSRIVDFIPDKGRRSFLQTAMASGIAAPIALASLTSGTAAAQTAGRGPRGAHAHGRHGMIVRDFADPYLELLRLLREGAEVEHAVMLQYLFGAFTIKDRYQSLIGFGAPSSANLLGVAVQEMQHLGAVNRLLVALGASPHLERQDFPYEPDIYPFAFQLEPFSRPAVAKYCYLEGPGEIFAAGVDRSPEDQRFRDSVMADIADQYRPNHVGSLYRHVLDLFAEASTRPGFPLSPAEVEQWHEGLVAVMHEGEHDHFGFFRQVYESKHPAFARAGVDNVWDLPLEHEAYPAHQVPHNPTAYIGHRNQIPSQEGQSIAWLGNLHYWISLCALDYGYRYDDKPAWDLSVSQMMTGMWPLATELAKYGASMPFDTLSMGYSPGKDREECRKFIIAMVNEADAFARSIESLLPSRYDQNAAKAAIEVMGG